MWSQGDWRGNDLLTYYIIKTFRSALLNYHQTSFLLRLPLKEDALCFSAIVALLPSARRLDLCVRSGNSNRVFMASAAQISTESPWSTMLRKFPMTDGRTDRQTHPSVWKVTLWWLLRAQGPVLIACVIECSDIQFKPISEQNPSDGYSSACSVCCSARSGWSALKCFVQAAVQSYCLQGSFILKGCNYWRWSLAFVFIMSGAQ